MSVCSGRSSAALALAFFCAAAPLAAQPLLQLPLDCDIGRSCFVQNYVDADPGPGASDFRCGTRSYNDHDGTDIRVRTLAQQQAGVAVLAAAAGRVAGRRDGMADISVREGGREAIAGRECGNGVTLDHGDGWQTQYCHMARGSVTVKVGDTVAAGQRLGSVGISGMTEYPHLHFTVRQGAQTVDPFAFGAPAGACGAGQSLWAPEVAVALAYQERSVLNTGFAAAPVSMAGIGIGEDRRAASRLDRAVRLCARHRPERRRRAAPRGPSARRQRLHRQHGRSLAAAAGPVHGVCRPQAASGRAPARRLHGALRGVARGGAGAGAGIPVDAAAGALKQSAGRQLLREQRYFGKVAPATKRPNLACHLLLPAIQIPLCPSACRC